MDLTNFACSHKIAFVRFYALLTGSDKSNFRAADLPFLIILQVESVFGLGIFIHLPSTVILKHQHALPRVKILSIFQQGCSCRDTWSMH